MDQITYVGIDPGKGGGIAWMDSDGLVDCINMPETVHDLADHFRNQLLPGPDDLMVCLEKVHSMPRDGVASAFKFGRQTGQIQGVLAALGIPYEEVSPQKWQKVMELPKDKAERKRAIKAAMQARYPDCRVTLKTADALGILTFYKEKSRG